MRTARTGIGLAGLAAAVLFAAGLARVMPAAEAGGRRDRAMVRRSAAIDAMIAAGRLESIETYGSGPGALLLVGGAPADLDAAAGAAGSPAGLRRVEDRIRLRARTIDTSLSLPAAPSGSSLSRPGAGGRLELIQFPGPVKSLWLRRLRGAGHAPIAYLPDNAYLVWLDDPAAPDTTGVPLRWRGPLEIADRLSPDLRSTQQPIDVTVQVARAGAFETAMATIRARAAAVLAEPRSIGRMIDLRVTLAPGVVDEIAQIPEVAWIEPFEPIVTHDERSALIVAGQVSASKPLGPGYLEWLAARHLDDLSGTIVDVADTGIDVGGTAIVQPGLKGRIAYSEDHTPEGLTEDCAGHGTNIAGIIAGGYVPGVSFFDADGYLPGLGLAPTARLGATRIFDCGGHLNPAVPFTDLVASAYAHGARIGNNSWGGAGSQYNAVAAEYDAVVRDADLDPLNGDQGFLSIFSVGNLGPNSLTVGWPATAKNVLSVGGTENYRPGVTDGCGLTGQEGDNVDHVLAISSRGPTADGRVKPDLVAPGSRIQSLASTAIDYSGIGLCNPYFPAGQHLLNWSSGTSQAAAHVTGAAAIAAEVYRRRFGASPSPAMLKAMLINHAHDMGTSIGTPSNTTNRPNFLQGWGRADIGALADARARVAFDQTRVMTATGEEFTAGPLVTEDPSQRVIVTLVWTDAPGTPLGWSFVNDLDLSAQADGVTYLGNVFDHGVSVPGGKPDERNNVEMIVLPAGTRTTSVTVTAANLAGDGVPSVPGETDQDFALYISNARLADDNGLIDFARADAVCGAPATVRLADRQLSGFGTTTVLVDSAGDHETMVLKEDPAGSGVFGGAIDVAGPAAAPGDGVLQTSDRADVTASYTRVAAGTGLPETRSATIVARCAPPALTQARVSLVGDNEATVTWDTDRPADSVVSYGLGSNRILAKSDPKRVTRHAVRLQGLAGCSFYTAQVSSTDVSGLTGTAPATPLSFSTGPGVKGRRILFEDDMESLGSRWTHAAGAPGGVDDWALGFPAQGPPGPFSGGRVWGTRLDASYSVGSDSVLISPPIDLRDAVGPQLTFMHYYAISGGLPPSSRNDGAWVEATNDGGVTWAPIEPAGGYPETIDDDNPYLSRATRVYAGALTNWTRATFDLTSYGGQLIQVRFHFWQDRSETNPRMAGWFIDDVEVSAQGVCHQGRVTLDADRYGCSSRVKVRLSDSDLNLQPLVVETATVTAQSPSGRIPLVLTETGPATGQFAAALDLTATPAPGKLAVVEGDAISLTYDDADSGGGAAAAVSASALVPDCTPPPPPAAVSALAGGAFSIAVSWTPVDPAAAPDLQGYRVHYDTDGSGPAYSGVGAFQGVSPVRLESAPGSVTLSSLSPCVPHFVTVTSFDSLGNESAFAPEGYAVPNGTSSCANARLTAAPANPGCRESILLTVSDSNADPNPQTAGTVTALATGPSHAGALAVTLTESAPASGVFLGTLPLSPTPAAGALTTAQDDLVTATYVDADDGRGRTRTLAATARVSDCTPPLISDIDVTNRSTDRAIVRWTTDEPSTSTVRFGFDASLGFTATVPGLATTHAVPIDGLIACSTIHYDITSVDARGNAATAGGGAPLRFGTYREVPVFTDDFESGAPGWTHTGFPGASDEWELGAPVHGVQNGPPAAFSGTSLWGTDLDGPYENGADMVLVSPLMDLTAAQSATLTFKHWYDIFSSGPPDGFDDGAFVEVSTDDGATWTYVTPVGGYPDRISSNPWVPFGSRGYAGLSTSWTTARFVLDAFVGHQVRVRFHLVEDGVEINEGHAGWYIDDVTLSRSVACHDAQVELDRATYPCEGSVARLKLFDVDLDLDPAAPDTAMVTVASGAEPQGERVTLVESGPRTGLFEGSLPISGTGAPGVLAVAQDDTIVASYQDADDGSGVQHTATAVARIPDCTPAAITGFQLADVGSDSFRVVWDTGEPSDSRVLYGATPALGQQVVIPESKTSHAVTVGGLQPCTRYHFTVASTDAAGNLSREDTTSGIRTLVTGGDADLMVETFGASALGWSHVGRGDTWSIDGSAVPGRAATAPGGVYARPTDDINSDFVLVSPPVDLSGAAHPILILRHAFDFPLEFQGGDGGWVEAWNGTRWATLTPDGDYPATLDAEAGHALAPLPGFSGVSSGTIESRFDLTAVAARLAAAGGSVTRVRFHVFVEGGQGGTGAGWTLDEVRVRATLDCRQGRLTFDRAALTCAAESAELQLHDEDLDGDPGSPDTASITVSSTGGPAPLALTMVETGPSTGTFRASAPLSAAGGAGTLRAAAGDRIRATYQDADDGTGSGAQIVAEVPVRACAAPVISRIGIVPAGDGFVATWATDRPATSEATLTPAAGPPLTASDHHLATSHRLVLPGAQSCQSYTAALASEDADGLRAVTGGPAGGLVAENGRRVVEFFDDMEGPDPGWTISGQHVEWQRGVPTIGPPGAFSGQKVYATDLGGFYDAGTNATLTTPPIDLTGAVAPRLTFWHWYDIFADSPPNSTDDSAWVEAQVVGGGPPVYLDPIGGYPDTSDAEGGQPLLEGTAVYAGQTNNWEKATFDLSAFAGKTITLRFRIWNDIIELLLNGRTGAGWYLDDVEVSDPRYCFPAPAVSSLSAPAPGAVELTQGTTVTGLTVTGAQIRPGAVASLGPGMTITASTVVDATQMTLDLTVDPRAPLGPRTLTIQNPDGQAATLAGAVLVVFDPGRADIDGSGRVDGSDLAALAAAFGSVSGETRYAAAADLDADGVVDGMDLALLASRFGLAP